MQAWGAGIGLPGLARLVTLPRPRSSDARATDRRLNHMFMRSTRHCLHLLKTAAISLALSLPAVHSHAQRIAEVAAGPFTSLAGTWAGEGTIKMTSGANERIRCRVSYAVENDGNTLRQELRCASDSYKFELTSTVNHRGGYITGMWTETTRHTGGKMSGRVNGEEIEGLVESSGFAANLGMTTRGDKQSVSIRPRGIDVAEVTISLRRGTR